MRRYRAIYSVLISLVMLVNPGCRQPRLVAVGMAELPELRLPIEGEWDKLTCKMLLATGRGSLSGIMVIKKMGPLDHRVAYFSEVGMSYLEGQLAGTFPYRMEIRSVNPFISSPGTIQDLEAGINLLLAGRHGFTGAHVMQDKEESYWFIGDVAGGGRYYGRLDRQGRVDRAFFKGMNSSAHYDYAPVSQGGKLSSMELMSKKGKTIMVLKGFQVE